MKHPLALFSKALELLEKEKAKEYHKIAVVRVEEFLQWMIGKNPTYHMRYNSQQISSTCARNSYRTESLW